MSLPSMVSRGQSPIAVFPINGEYILGIYQGKLSKFDLLLKYRQKDENTKSGWSRIRTPKHIHWAVDVLLKMHADEKKTKEFLALLLKTWNESIKPLKTEKERKKLLDVENLLREVSLEAKNYETLADKGEYSVKFLLLIARLLMVQEKTNLENAYMFKNLLEALKSGKDIFKIVQIATYR